MGSVVSTKVDDAHKKVFFSTRYGSKSTGDLKSNCRIKTNNTKEIKLSKGQIVLVDEVDFKLLNQHKWYLSTSGYAIRKPDTGTIRMHRIILNTPKNKFVDHVNGNKLDNRRENLRICSKTQNQGNLKKRSHNTTGFKGVWLDKDRNLFVAEIAYEYKKYHLGRFKKAKDAALAYNKKALQIYGPFALLNKI